MLRLLFFALMLTPLSCKAPIQAQCGIAQKTSDSAEYRLKHMLPCNIPHLNYDRDRYHCYQGASRLHFTECRLTRCRALQLDVHSQIRLPETTGVYLEAYDQDRMEVIGVTKIYSHVQRSGHIVAENIYLPRTGRFCVRAIAARLPAALFPNQLLSHEVIAESKPFCFELSPNTILEELPLTLI